MQAIFGGIGNNFSNLNGIISGTNNTTGALGTQLPQFPFAQHKQN